MSDVLTLPVLPLDDAVVLPGMVVPVRLDDSDTRAAVDAATAAAQDRDDGLSLIHIYHGRVATGATVRQPPVQQPRRQAHDAAEGQHQPGETGVDPSRCV